MRLELNKENALALLAVAWLSAAHPNARRAAAAGWLYLAGIVLISGSLYALGTTGTRALVLLTGLLLMAGWMVLAWTAIQSKEPQRKIQSEIAIFPVANYQVYHIAYCHLCS